MKTILVEVKDSVYKVILDFIKLLPENHCHLLEENEQLSQQEQRHIQHCLTQIQKDDYSEFEDWEVVKDRYDLSFIIA